MLKRDVILPLHTNPSHDVAASERPANTPKNCCRWLLGVSLVPQLAEAGVTVSDGEAMSGVDETPGIDPV